MLSSQSVLSDENCATDSRSLQLPSLLGKVPTVEEVSIKRYFPNIFPRLMYEFFWLHKKKKKKNEVDSFLTLKCQTQNF